MGNIRWIVLNALAITIIHAAPRELSSEELITEPRPGEEYVNIQTNPQDKINLEEQSFTTSHRIPQKKVTFETSHKVPPVEIKAREFSKQKSQIEPVEKFETAESQHQPSYEAFEDSTEAVRVVTRTSIKMSKSKKVQKSVIKTPHDVQLDIKSSEGTIDETANADEDVKEVMAMKHLRNDYEEEKKPLRFNVPFEDEVEVTGKPKLLAVGPAESSTLKIPTTEAPPITTFNYKNVYNVSKPNEIPNAEKYKYKVITSESIKTAESRILAAKKDTKQEKKLKTPKKEEEIKRQDTGFYVLPVNKGSTQISDDNFDFVDLDEKVLEPAGSSPGQSSRINIKKGPNGQEYEYVYYYYYYDDDDDGKNNTSSNKVKDEKPSTSTTSKVYNGHDGPTLETYQDKDATKSSTSGARYLPTESSASKRKKVQSAEVEEQEEAAPERSRGNGDRYKTLNRQSEAANNEILPVTNRPTSRSRGRNSTPQPVPADDIPSIGEERLPANTRFPPRSRNNSPTSPQPQETTSRTRNRESNTQTRVRLPNLGLLDSSSFRTHSSDASIDEDPIHDAELQRRPASSVRSRRSIHFPLPGLAIDRKIPELNEYMEEELECTEEAELCKTDRKSLTMIMKTLRNTYLSTKNFRTQTTEAIDPRRDEITTLSHRRLRPTTPSPIPTPARASEEIETPVSRRPANRRPVELAVPKEEEDEITTQEERVEKISGNGRRPETTRESDAEEGDFEITKPPYEGSNEVRASEVTTEDESAVGLTSAMMEKVALDLYAILQQAQDENIQTNFVDGNATDITTEDELYTEPTTLPSTTTTTTTTEPTTTTTTTVATTLPAGRGRYRTRGGAGAGLGKGRGKTTTTTTTTEPPVETTSQRTRGRFQPHGNRTPGGSRRVQKPKVEVEEETVPKEEAPKPTVERTFGGRNRFRGGVKPAGTTSTTTPAPSTASGASAVLGNRGSSVDRYNPRRRGNRVSVSTTSQPTAEDNVEPEQTQQEVGGSNADETTSNASLKPGTRTRVHPGARPLRPGPRVPLNLAHRGRVSSTTVATPAEVEEPIAEKEAAEIEQPASQGEEAQEPAVTPAPDALSRLKNRRLRIGPGSNQPRPSPSPVTPPANRKKLVSSLLPKRRPGEEKAVEKPEETVEERNEEEVYEEESPQSSIEPSSTTEADKGLPGLLNGRRRNLIRRPGTLYSRSSQQPEAP